MYKRQTYNQGSVRTTNTVTTNGVINREVLVPQTANVGNQVTTRVATYDVHTDSQTVIGHHTLIDTNGVITRQDRLHTINGYDAAYTNAVVDEALDSKADQADLTALQIRVGNNDSLTNNAQLTADDAWQHTNAVGDRVTELENNAVTADDLTAAIGSATSGVGNVCLLYTSPSPRD